MSVWKVDSYGFSYRAVIDCQVCDLAWSNSGSVLAMVTMSTISVAPVRRAAVRQWPVRTVAPWDAGRQLGNALVFSPDDDVLVVGAARGWATVALDTGEVDWVSAEPTRSVRFTPGGDLLVGGEDGTLSLWRPRPWRKQASVVLYPEGVGSIAVSGDGTLAATTPGVQDDTGDIGMRVVQLPALTVVDRSDDDVDRVTFRPRRDQLTVGYDRHGTVELYNLTRCDDDGLVLHNREDRVNHLAYNRTGNRLVAASFQSGEAHQLEVLSTWPVAKW